MCGIAGMAGIADKHLLDEMLLRIRHRGPDDSGTWLAEGNNFAERVALGNNRLSIIDLSPMGHQPMSNEDATVWVAYNGEIYNFKSLREGLLADGHVFRSNSDTEVLVHLYEQHGEGMLGRLNGMFAFALWDVRAQRLLIARDRMGIKPLYYSQCGKRLYFASEIKSLLASPEVDTKLDPIALNEFIALLYVPDPRTLFHSVRKLPPGHFMRWEAGKISIAPYWDVRAGNYFTASEDELAAEFRAKLVAATESQLISDVPVGFFLSGGLDSSSLLACAHATGHRDLNCYSIAFTSEHGRLEQNTLDAMYARQVAARYGARFHELTVAPDAAELLPRSVWHMDDPVADHAAIATLLISEAARNDVKVLISGQGGDEVLAGYRVYWTPSVTAKIRRLPRALRGALRGFINGPADSMARKLPGNAAGLALAATRYGGRMLQLAEVEPDLLYANARSYYSVMDLRALLAPGLRELLQVENFEDVFIEHIESGRGNEGINQLLYLDAKIYLPAHNLAYTDRMSMAASMEVRVPFLDNSIVEFLERVPPHMKLRGLKGKRILRRAMAGVLPWNILHRRKAGFGLPVRSWLRNELRDMVGDLLSERRIRERGLFEPAAVAHMVEENASGARDFTQQVWTLLTLELWQQKFMDEDQVFHPAPASVLR